MKTLHILMPIVLLSIILSACNQTTEENQQALEKKVTSNEPVGKPLHIDPELATQGKMLYNQNCVFCHQKDAIGKPGFAPSLTNKEFLSIASNKFLMSTIRDGRPGTGMPPFAHLGRKQVEAIVAFLKSHGHISDLSDSVNAQPSSHGDPRLGKIWFEQICSTCHGPDGDGYIAGSTGTAIGKPGFLNKASDGFIRYTIKNGRTNTRMMGFKGPDGLANLSDSEIDDIIAYLRTLSNKS